MTAPFGELLIKFSILFGVLYAVALGLVESRRAKVLEPYLHWGARGLSIFLSGALFLLFKAFYTPNFNLNYVFTRVSTATPLHYRLSALWVGQEGVFLVWAWAISISLLFFSERGGLKRINGRKALIVLTLLCIFFTALAVVMTPFKPTMDPLKAEAAVRGVPFESLLKNLEATGVYNSAQGFIEGQGMSPVLQSPWMALHPPIVFIAYALASIPFALCLVYLITGEGEWERGSRQWARLSWIFLSLGLVIGSYWAYEELSFGGYWTWDPIETASLIPWVTLVVFLHGSYEYQRKGRFALITPVVGVLTTILIIYGTFITKSGLIQSSHAYERSAITPMLASALGLAILLLLIGAIRMYFKDRGPAHTRGPLVSITNAFYLSVILFGLLLGVLLWGITYPLYARLSADKTVVIGKAFYNLKGYPIAAMLVLLTGFCLLLWVVKKREALIAAAGVMVISLAGLLLKPTGNLLIDTFMPIGFFSIASAALRMQKELTINRGDRAPVIKALGGHFLHLGIAVLLIGVVTSANLQINRDLAYPYPEGVGTKLDAGGGYEMTLLNLNVFQAADGSWVQLVNVTIHKEGKELGDLTLRLKNDRRFGRFSKVSIKRGFTSDLYAVYYGISGGHEEGRTILPINVKVNPYVSLVWIGSMMIIISAALIYAVEALSVK